MEKNNKKIIDNYINKFIYRYSKEDLLSDFNIEDKNEKKSQILVRFVKRMNKYMLDPVNINTKIVVDSFDSDRSSYDLGFTERLFRHKFSNNEEFYKSIWKFMKIKCLIRDDAICTLCFLDGDIEKTNIEHHILSIRDFPELCLNPFNLISLCKEHHKNISYLYSYNSLFNILDNIIELRMKGIIKKKYQEIYVKTPKNTNDVDYIKSKNNGKKYLLYKTNKHIIKKYIHLLKSIKEINESGFGCRQYEMRGGYLVSKKQLPHTISFLRQNGIIYIKEERRDMDRITGKRFKTKGNPWGAYYISDVFMDFI